MAAADAKKIRTALKTAGYGTKRVGVRNSNYAGGSSVRVTIKDPQANFDEVKQIAKDFQRVSYCEYSGEILSGGNFFVFTEWTEEARDARAEPFIPAVKEAFAHLGTLPRDTHANIGETDLTLSREGSGCSNVLVWSAHRMERMVWCDGADFKELAFTVAGLIG